MTARSSPPAVEPSTYDFDLHGVVGIRLLDATQADAAIVGRQLGPLDAALDREPDITIRFVDRLTDQPISYVGFGDTGFNDEGFFILRGRGGVAAKALLPFDRVGERPQIMCERGMPAVPHLLALINLTALTKGVLPLHASAFTTAASTGVLVTGWAKGGKTESLLGGMSSGGQYVGDEWIYLTADRRMLGLPEPIRLWAWHLEQFPALLRARPRSHRLQLGVWKHLAAMSRTASESSLAPRAIARRARPIIERQAYLQIPPTELFGADRIVLHGSLDAVVLVLNHSSPDFAVGPAGPTEVSGRMLASLADEREALLAHYRQFCFAFPERRNAVIEAAGTAEASLLSALFDNRPAAKVGHPYPCDIAELGRTVMAAADQVQRPVARS